ncbi:MAG: hypothetical protein Q7S55_00255 [Nanoarchaeota archaeon]|nr:hypothetical protein [Nanoarchaeota archaeon]
MSRIRDYLTLAYHGCFFDIGYGMLQQNPDDREVLAITFEHGRRALWALDDLGKEDKELSDRVYQLSKQIKEKRITRDDAPYMFPPNEPPEF